MDVIGGAAWYSVCVRGVSEADDIAKAADDLADLILRGMECPG